jgi:predicted NBD/HSP70 family sugar kinase
MSTAEAVEERIRAALPGVSTYRARALAEAVARLVDTFRPDRVFLFGSQ